MLWWASELVIPQSGECKGDLLSQMCLYRSIPPDRLKEITDLLESDIMIRYSLSPLAWGNWRQSTRRGGQ